VKFVIVASTNGSVINELLVNPFFHRQIFSLVSDRVCGALEKAAYHGIRTDLILEPDKVAFSDRLLDYLETFDIDFVISFFTVLFVGRLLQVYKDRIVNLHPSLLPSFKGLKGFENTIGYGVRFGGSTINFIDEAMDEGKIILQTVYPVNPKEHISLLRHRVFEQQCKSLLQVVKWIDQGRVHVEGKNVIIDGARFDNYEYSPALDFEDAVRLSIPLQGV